MSSRPPPQQNTERNDYIPSYISKAPFYAQGLSDADYLEHQRSHAESKDTLDKAKWYERGRKAGPAATKYRKGACENCGAMTHKTKECLSRPRKHGAKWTGKDIQADEKVEDVRLGWDAKRDRWNGYDSREYAAVIKEHEEMEALRQTTKSQAAQRTDEDVENEEPKDDSDRYAEETDMGRSQSNSTRQLRLREDTAKYLLNLDLDSAEYNPKTRTMDTTSSSLPPANAEEFDGFIRPTDTSDDAAAFERAQKYAWETQESTKPSSNAQKLHLQANPTEGEILLRKRQVEDAERKESRRKLLLSKYGEQPASTSTNSALQKPLTSSESYIEYDIHGQPKNKSRSLTTKPKSKYAEDIMINNHTSIWGSWWLDFTWGYACCHSTTKNSYCTGDAGRAAFEEAENLRTGQALISDVSHDNNKAEQTVTTDQADQLRQEQEGEDIGTRKDEGVGDTSRLEEAPRSPLPPPPLKKRTFAELQSGVTEEELEAYKRNRTAADDPMRAFGRVGEDGLLEH